MQFWLRPKAALGDWCDSLLPDEIAVGFWYHGGLGVPDGFVPWE